MWFYDNFKKVCAAKGTTITQALKGINRATACTGGWASGQYPRLDIVVELADYLGVSLDELVFARTNAESDGPVVLSASEREWLSVISQIPLDKQPACLDFLKTHMAAPKKYRGKTTA